MDEFVDSSVISSVATSSVSTIQDVLDGQVDVCALSFSCDFNSVGQGRKRSVSPATSAILWDVLVQGSGD